jgi:hypothetical protein
MKSRLGRSHDAASTAVDTMKRRGAYPAASPLALTDIRFYQDLARVGRGRVVGVVTPLSRRRYRNATVLSH